MNIDTFEKNQLTSHDHAHSDTSSHDDVANLKLKIEKRKSKQKRLQVVIITLIASVLILASLFGYTQYKLYSLSRQEMNESTNIGTVTSTSKSQDSQTGMTEPPKTPEAIIKALGRHILLPEGTPQIAEVEDVEKLREKQAFFKNAKNGDIVVVYESMIFLYRPSLDIVIASGDISGIEQKNP